MLALSTHKIQVQQNHLGTANNPRKLSVPNGYFLQYAKNHGADETSID
jgi:hypothetical protein